MYRDEAQSKMIALKEKADKDLVQYNMELKELIRIIDHDRKLKEFMRIKGEERAELADKELELKQRKKESEKDKGDREETVEVIWGIWGSLWIDCGRYEGCNVI